MGDSDVLIIGAGISGLSTAWWLAQQGIQVEVWESAAVIGGKIHSTNEQGYLSESAAGLLVNFRPDIDQVINQCGLDSNKQQRPEGLSRYVLHNSKLCAVPMTITGIARSPLWSRSAKLRMLSEGLVRGQGESGESVSSFIQRRFGKEMLDTAIDPFVSGTLASDPDLAEAASVLPKLKELEQRYGSISVGILVNRLWKRRRVNRADTFSFHGGMSQLIEAMGSTPGIQLRPNVTVQQISKNKHSWEVLANTPHGDKTRHCQQLVLTTPADVSAKLLSTIDLQLSDLLNGIEYTPLAVLHMGFDRRLIKHPLDGTGFLAGKNGQLGLNGNLWMSSLFPGRAPKEKVLLSTYLGGVRRPDQLVQDDDTLMHQTLSGLAPLLGIEGKPDYMRIDRHEKGLPLYHGHYQARLEQINQQINRLPGLSLCGNFAGGVSVRERIYQGKLLAQHLIQDQQVHWRRSGHTELHQELSTAQVY